MSDNYKKDVIQSVTNIVTIISLVYGFVQYCHYKKNLRVERSMSFNSKFFDTEIVNANKKFKSGEDDRENVEKIVTLSAGNKSLKDKLIRMYLVEKVQANQQDWFTLYDFYSSVYQCIDKELCDKESISHSIKSSGLKFFKNYVVYNCKYESYKTDTLDTEMLRKVRKFYYPKFKDCNFKTSY